MSIGKWEKNKKTEKKTRNISEKKLRKMEKEMFRDLD